MQWARGDHGLPLVRVTHLLQGLVTGGDVHGHRPRPRIPGQREQREGVERGKQPGDELGGAAVRRAEVARVVGEPGVFGFLGHRLGSQASQPAGQPGPPPHRVDDQVGGEFFAVRGAHAGHIRHALGRGLAGHQLGDRQPPANVQLPGGGAGDRVLDHRAAAGDRDEPLVSLAWRPVFDERRHEREHVERGGARAAERLRHLWQGRVQDLAPGRVQVVGLAELGDAVPVPRLPRLVRRAGHAATIPFQDGDLVPLFREHHRHRKPDDPAACYHDPRHSEHPRGSRLGLVHSAFHDPFRSWPSGAETRTDHELPGQLGNYPNGVGVP